MHHDIRIETTSRFLSWRGPHFEFYLSSFNFSMLKKVSFVSFTSAKSETYFQTITLKLVSTTFYQIFIFYQMIALQKL